MPYLNFIDDEKFEKIVSNMLAHGIGSVKSKKDFSKNVIDPFALLFEMSSFSIDYVKWVENENLRQAQKSLTNKIGNFHQNLLGAFEGWESLSTGGIVDVICHEKKIIAEIKNKHNTVTGSNLAAMHYKLDDLVMLKGQIYKDYTAYFVNIIPQKPMRYNIPFIPSDSRKGAKCPTNEKVRVIDGYSFYALATGVENALEQIYKALPFVIKKLKPDFIFPNQEEIFPYFKAAFLGK